MDIPLAIFNTASPKSSDIRRLSRLRLSSSDGNSAFIPLSFPQVCQMHLPVYANLCHSAWDYAGRCSVRQEDYGMNSEAWVSIDAIARHLDVSKDTCYRLIDQRDMPAGVRVPS